MWLINSHNGIKEKGIKPININDYPAIKKHLDQYWNKISTRADKGDTPYNLRNCAYMDDFNRQKIVWIELSDESKFAISDNLTPLNTVFFMTGERIIPILGYLNSKLILWYFTHCLGTTSGVGTNRWLKYKMEDVPLSLIYPDIFEKQIINILKLKKQKLDTKQIELTIENIICDIYQLNSSEKDFILQ